MSKERRASSLTRRWKDVQISELQELLSKKEEELNKTRATLDGIREERDQLRRKVHKLLSELNTAKESASASDRQSQQDLRPCSGLGKHALVGTGTLQASRKAERVRVIKTAEFKRSSNEEKPKSNVLGADLDHEKLSTAAAEQIVQEISTASGAQEILSGLDSSDGNFAKRLRENFELEMERMSCQFEGLKSENGLLRLTLQESKSRTEQLQMLLSKFESNNTAHGMTLFFSELIIEGLQAMLDIMEKETTKKTYLEDAIFHTKETNKQRLRRVAHGLKAVVLEETALSAVPMNVAEFLEQCEEKEGSHPEEVSSVFELCRRAEQMKEAVKRSIINLESFSIGSLQTPLRSEKQVSEFDLENAVLLHELTYVKEELVKLKCEYMKANCNNESSPFSHQSQGALHQDKVGQSSSTSSFDFAFNGSLQSVHGKETESELNKKPAFLSLADLRIGTMTESELGTELSEALKREERLKKDNDRLAFALQQVQQNSEKRHLKSMEVMQNLKTSYSTLLENNKKDRSRHISRVQELEQVLCFTEEQHQSKIRDLKQQILIYEREKENWSLPDNETAL